MGFPSSMETKFHARLQESPENCATSNHLCLSEGGWRNQTNAGGGGLGCIERCWKIRQEIAPRFNPAKFLEHIEEMMFRNCRSLMCTESAKTLLPLIYLLVEGAQNYCYNPPEL